MTTETLTPFPDYFMEKVAVAPDGCWLWQGRQNRNGYGRLYVRGSGGDQMAHRYAYTAAVGLIPEGYQLDHLCRVRHCVNPEHLEPVTQRENLLRGETVTAQSAAAEACPAGHSYSGDNLYVNRKGHRYCRTCHRERVAAARVRDPEKMRAQARAADARYRARKRAERDAAA